MKRIILQKKMCIWLAVLMLACGICLSVSQTDSFVVYSTSETEIPISSNYINNRWVESHLSVLNPLDNYRAEQMLGKFFSGRMKYHNGHGEHEIIHMIFGSFFYAPDADHKAMLESDVVYHLCSALIIDYVHLTDGAKG